MAQSIKEYAFLSYDKNVFLRAKKIVCKKAINIKIVFAFINIS